MAIYRLDGDGLIAERWQEIDGLALFAQLGLLPRLRAAEPGAFGQSAAIAPRLTKRSEAAGRGGFPGRRRWGDLYAAGSSPVGSSSWR